MIIPIKASLEVGRILDLVREAGKWSLWDGETLIETDVKVKDTQLGLDKYKAIVGEGGSVLNLVRYVNLHQHTDNSLQDGMVKVSDLVKHTEYAGAITDHGVMYGFLEFYKTMKKAGKKPIIGMEAYQEDLKGQLSGMHLVLLAKNNTGYRNLVKLASKSYDHFYRKPHVTWPLLQEHHEGIIVLTACLGGLIPKLLLDGNWDAAKYAVEKFKDIFGEDFYIEVQRHGLREEEIVNPKLLALAKECGVKVVATTDSHYLRKEDAYAHEVLLCLQTKKQITDEHMKFEGTGYHVHTSEEMEALFSDLPEALDNTLLIAEQCEVEIELGNVNLPNYELPEGFTEPAAYFEHLCEEGFKKRFKGTPLLEDPVYKERYEHEMAVIHKMGFETYFLIVQDFVNYARSVNVYIGPGRGSAAGSLLAYCLGITDMDPIRFNLLFERFLNPERVSWPDMDIDIESVGRQKVIDYMVRKYGADNVCRIVTFGTMAAKMAVKDVARVFGMPPAWASNLAKMIPEGPKVTLAKALDTNPELRNRYQSDPDVARVLDVAKALEGTKRHSSLHACGVVCAPSEVSDFLPTSMELDKDTKERAQASQVTMAEVEELSLLKMDLLGLKNLTAIHEVIRTIKKTRGVYIRYQDLPLDDRETYKMLAAGHTSGVFQLESPGMTNVVTQMLSDVDSLPDDQMEQCFERLIAAVALYRPGPMDYIPQYIDGMRDPSKVHYDCPQERDILSRTYGVMVYQEQMMQVAQAVAGYTLAGADLLRRACGKKKKDVMAAEKDVFINGSEKVPGCLNNGISQPVAEEIWAKIEKFAEYAFNRSHAACYAWISSITAYMSCHWTPEFYCAMINAFQDNGDKVKSYMGQAVQRGVKLLPPDINKSEEYCTVEDGCIRIGFRQLTGLNKAGKAILKERKAKGSFTGAEDFYNRMADSGEKPGKAMLESLIFSGSMDGFGLNKRRLTLMFKILESSYKKDAVNRALGQYSLFSDPIQAPEADEFDEAYLMDSEFKAVGIYLSRHPVDALYEAAAGRRGYVTISDLAVRENPERSLMTFGVIKDLRQLFTKKEEEMYVFSVSDRFNSVRCVLFPKRVPANKHRLMDGAVVKLAGEFVVEENEGSIRTQIIVQDVMSKDEVLKTVGEKVTVEVRNKAEQDMLLAFVKKNPGESKVVLAAMGKEYELKYQLMLTPETLDWLTENFAKVS